LKGFSKCIALTQLINTVQVPLSKVLQGPNNGYNSGGNTGERGYSEGGGGRGFESSASAGVGVPGEGRNPSYGNNVGVAGNVGEGYRGGGFGGNDYGGSNQNNYVGGKPNGPENYGKTSELGFGGDKGNYGGQGIMYDSEEAANGGGFSNGGGNDNLNYQNDANLGMAYGAAVGNALPQNGKISVYESQLEI